MSRASGGSTPHDAEHPYVPAWPHLIDGPGDGEGPEPSRRPVIASISILVAIMLIAAGGLLFARFLNEEPIRPAPPLDTVAGPAVPTEGAYIGAWAKPTRLTDDGRKDASDELEEGIGRRLDIIHVFRLWDEPFPTSSDLDYIKRGYFLQLSWADTDTKWREVAAGKFDDMIAQRARAVRALGKSLFLQWRWEMDRPNLALNGTAKDYVAAWKHIKTIFDIQGATDVAWVWCPTADGFSDGRAVPYYPGDDWVDWLCADAYPGPDWRPLKDVLAPFLAWAKDHPRPIMIGEYGVARDRGSEDRVAYLRAAEAAFRADSQIKAVCYFDSNPTGNGARRQYMLRDDPEALDEFRRMVSSPYFNPRGLPVA